MNFLSLNYDVHLPEDPATSAKGLGHGRQWPRDSPGQPQGETRETWETNDDVMESNGEMLGKPIDFPIQ